MKGADEYKISVIIPVYGVEAYIERCVRSLMEQTMTDSVEFIFVNDATKDCSIGILEKVLLDYPDKISQVKILNHDVNRGLPAARNTGLDAATGEYVLHIDGDDFAEPRMLEILYKALKDNDADMAWCDYYITFANKRRVIAQPSFDSPIEAIKGMLRGTMKYNVWNKMCRRSLYVDNDISFPDGNPMGEDLTMIMVALYVQKCAVVKEPLYNYVQNPGQMSAVFDEKKLDSLLFNCKRLLDYISANFSYLALDSEYPAFCQLMKWPFLLDGKISSYRRWLNWFPASNHYIWSTCGVNNRIKFIEWCAAKHLYPIVWFHYLLIIKLYYGFIYKK